MVTIKIRWREMRPHKLLNGSIHRRFTGNTFGELRLMPAALDIINKIVQNFLRHRRLLLLRLEHELQNKTKEER